MLQTKRTQFSGVLAVFVSLVATLVALFPAAALGVTIGATGCTDMVYNPTNGVVYVTAGNQIIRYDWLDQRSLPSWTLGSTLMGIDVSPDGTTLAVADSSQDATSNWVFLVDTTSGASRQVRFPLSDMEGGTYSVAFDANGGLEVSSRGGGGWVNLRRYSLASQETTVICWSVRYDSLLAPSADRSHVAWAESNISPGEYGTYDSKTGILRRAQTTWPTYEIATNHDGSINAIPTYGALAFTNLDLGGLGSVPVASNGAAFHPNANVLFASSSNSNAVVAYDSDTHNIVNFYTLPETLPWASNRAFVPGHLKIGGGGALLLVKLSNGIDVVPTGYGPTTSRISWTSGTSGRLFGEDGSWSGGLALTASLEGTSGAALALPSVSTHDRGSWSVAIPPSSVARTLRMSFAGNATLTSVTATIAVAPDLTLRVVSNPSAKNFSRRRRRGVAHVVLQVAVRNADGSVVSGVPAVLQTSTNGSRWNKAATTTTRRNGWTTVSLAVKRRGRFYVRWTFGARAPYLPRTTPAQKVTIR